MKRYVLLVGIQLIVAQYISHIYAQEQDHSSLKEISGGPSGSLLPDGKSDLLPVFDSTLPNTYNPRIKAPGSAVFETSFVPDPQFYSMFRRTDLFLHKEIHSAIGVAKMESYQVGVRWRPADKWEMQVAGFVNSSYNYTIPFQGYSYGVKAEVLYRFAPRWGVRLHGQYAWQQGFDPFMQDDYFAPHTGVGAFLEYNMNKRTRWRLGTEVRNYRQIEQTPYDLKSEPLKMMQRWRMNIKADLIITF